MENNAGPVEAADLDIGAQVRGQAIDIENVGGSHVADVREGSTRRHSSRPIRCICCPQPRGRYAAQLDRAHHVDKLKFPSVLKPPRGMLALALAAALLLAALGLPRVLAGTEYPGGSYCLPLPTAGSCPVGFYTAATRCVSARRLTCGAKRRHGAVRL
jgi:hypothetical protein